MKVLAAASALSAALTLGVAASASGQSHVTTVGQFGPDANETRPAASAIATAARHAGYTGTAYTNGRTADQAFADGKDAAIWAFFGHSDAGILSTYDAPDNANDQYMIAGDQADVVSLYVNTRTWSEYLPAVDVDDVRLAIVGGCYSARTDAGYGSFPEAGTRLGMDSVVTFNSLVYFPAYCPDCITSGNYFWDRASTYLDNGTSIVTALAQARTDLVAREGDDKGWGSYRIAGAASNPGGVKLRPAGPGSTTLSALTIGTTPVSLAHLMTQAQRNSARGSFTRADGTTLRVDSAGRPLDVTAPAALRGVDIMGRTTATKVAQRFLSDWPGSDSLAHQPPSSIHLTHHVRGEHLVAVAWRPTGRRGTQALVEVDRRTGSVTYAALSKAPRLRDASHMTVDKTMAVSIARAALRERASLVSVERDPWNRSLWVVHLRGPEPDGMPNHALVSVNGVTGEVDHVDAS